MNDTLALRISDALYCELSSHLGIGGAQRDARAGGDSEANKVEQAAFLLTDQPAPNGAIVVKELHLITAGDFEIQSAFHISLADRKRGELLRWAWEAGGCLFEAHSHLDEAPARFSASDISGFGEWVPHVWWRLGARPYGALVFASESFDGLVWRKSPELPEQLHQIVTDDGHVLEPTRQSLRRWGGGSAKPRKSKRKERQ